MDRMRGDGYKPASPTDCGKLMMTCNRFISRRFHLIVTIDTGDQPMKNGLTFCITMMFVLSLSSLSMAMNLAVITGGEKGTYYQFGLNLQELAKANGINLTVYHSTGSIENLYAVYQRPSTQMGIVQSDVLAFVSRVQTDTALQKIASKTKMVFPLYNEEVHLLGRPGISDFDDLAGQRVAIGMEGSGTYLTAKLLFEVSDVKPAQLVPIGASDALTHLKTGKVDAMFYVAGYPVKLFEQDVTVEDELAIIPIRNKSILEFYPKSEIPATTYGWQPTKIDTVAVKAVLVSYNFRRLNCENVGHFAQLLNDQFVWLQEHGHPKWKSVDLSYQLKGWEQYDCVQKYLVSKKKVPNTQTTDTNPILDAVKNMLGQ
jgi:TRAP transporter TAXI family solute receptor